MAVGVKVDKSAHGKIITDWAILYPMSTQQHHILGIDEAGRGPLAGPIAFGIAKFSATFNKRLIAGIKDSKKLTAKQREEWFLKMSGWKADSLLDFHVALISAQEIDSKGLRHCIKKAIKICLRKVKADFINDKLYLDGGLKAPEEFLHQQTIIKGDEKIPVISLASIAAKVTRDRYMVKISKEKAYKKYKFEVHKGYGTKLHRELIKKHKPSNIHRLSFLKSLGFGPKTS